MQLQDERPDVPIMFKPGVKGDQIVQELRGYGCKTVQIASLNCDIELASEVAIFLYKNKEERPLGDIRAVFPPEVLPKYHSICVIMYPDFIAANPTALSDVRQQSFDRPHFVEVTVGDDKAAAKAILTMHNKGGAW